MGNQGLNDQWVDFKGRTSIHGFAEFDGMRNNIARVAWIVFTIVIGVFCGIQLHSIFSAYINDDPSTAIEVATSVGLPDLNLVFDERFSAIAGTETLDAVTKEIIEIQNEEFSFEGSCLPELDRVMGTDDRNGEYAENGNETEPGNQESESPLLYVHGWTKEEIQAEVRRYDADMNAFHENLMKILPPAEKILSAANVLKKKVNRKLDVGKIQIGTPGYVLVVPTSDLDTTAADAIHLTHSPELGQQIYKYKLGFRAPGGWFNGDLGGFIDILAGGMDYYLAVSLVVYKRDKTYCDENLKNGIDCFTKCEIDKAKESGSCIHYLGNLTDADGLKICSFVDWSQCQETTKVCADYCEGCKSCRDRKSVV